MIKASTFAMATFTLVVLLLGSHFGTNSGLAGSTDGGALTRSKGFSSEVGGQVRNASGAQALPRIPVLSGSPTPTPTPTPTPKSNRDLCIEGDPGACRSYSKEIERECGSQPVLGKTPTQQEYESNSKWLACMRRAQCWGDRVMALNQVIDLCAAGEDKPECVEARDRIKHVDPTACDKADSNVF